MANLTERRQVGMAYHWMDVTVPGVGCFNSLKEAQEALEGSFGAVEMTLLETDGFMDKYIIVKA